MIKEKTHPRKRIIDLTGPEGNAFILIGIANNIYTQLGVEHFKLLHGILSWEEIKDQLTSGDYENLIQTFDKYFGSIIDLER